MDDVEPKALVDGAADVIADIRAQADRQIAAVVRMVEQQTGVSLLVRNPSIMDATRDQLMAADLRAQHALAALKLIRGFEWPPDVRTLGEFMRGLPDDIRERIAEHLVEAGQS
ncbi:hypothetical protein [Streptomyces sp. NPDC005385]|uniref:hypothetical protein n=1 Tax=Streptomyces sp. NPDC005385 TaxID=3157039 RepID=UPI0033A609B0